MLFTTSLSVAVVLWHHERSCNPSFHFRNFCTVWRRATQHQQNLALQSMQILSVTLRWIFCHSHSQLSKLWVRWLTKSAYQELRSVFFRTFQLFFGVSLLVTFAELLRIFACALSFHGVSQGRRKSGRAGRTEKYLGQCKLIKKKKIVNKYACLCSAAILT